MNCDVSMAIDDVSVLVELKQIHSMKRGCECVQRQSESDVQMHDPTDTLHFGC